MKKSMVSVFVLAGLVSSVLAQTDGTYVITSSNIVRFGGPTTTTVEIWAMWTSPDFVFGGGNYDLSADDGTFSGETNVLNGPGSTPGVAAGNVVSGASNGQLHLPPLGFFGSTDNPILLASYTWGTTDFTPRFVNVLSSATNNFIVADLQTGATTQMFPSDFTDGAGVIEVMPAPSALALLGLGGLVASRRRR